MPAKAGRSSYPNEPPRAKSTQALRSTGEKNTSPVSATSHAAIAVAETEPPSQGALQEQLRQRASPDGADGVLEEAPMQANQTVQVNNPNSDQETVRFFGGEAANTGSNGEAQPTAAISNTSPSPAADDPADVLLNQVAKLEARAAGLAQQLLEGAGQLESGSIPDESLPSSLTLFQTDMKTVQRQTAELAQSLSVPFDAAMTRVEAFRGLNAVLAAIREAQSRNAFRDLHAQAARELESALAIRPRGGEEFAPLDESRNSAKRLLAEIVGAQWPDSHPESLPLVERRHPYSRLLDLVRDSDRLSDRDWEAAQEAVATAFGRPLAVAAVRGRLQLKAGPDVAAEGVSRCPTCKAELEPGARFCGDCGVRID